MRRVLPHEELDEAPTAPSWLLTYSDMVTLILAFFVLLVSMSHVETTRFHRVLNGFTGRSETVAAAATALPPASPAARVMEGRAYTDMMAYLKREGLGKSVLVNVSQRGLELVIQDHVLFASGSATLTPRAQDLLGHLAPLVNGSVQQVAVEGHSDNQPIQNTTYPSNWELSAARAATVVRYLVAQPNALPPASYSAIGLGEFHPLDTNDTPDGRTRNRRIEITLSWKSWQKNPSPLR